MSTRVDYVKAAPAAYKAAGQLDMALKTSGLEYSLFELVKTRASQINGCAYCVHMHTSDAMKHGETAMRLFMLNAWREVLALHAPRARGAGLDGEPDADRRQGRAGRPVRGAEAALQ